MVDASEVEAVIGLARRTISTQWFTVCAHKEMLDGLDLQLQLHSVARFERHSISAYLSSQRSQGVH